MGQEEEGEGLYDHFEKKKLMRAVIVNKEEKLRS